MEFFWKEFFVRNFLEEFWEEFFVYIGIELFVKILIFVKILSQGRRKEEFLILRSASTSSSHLKIVHIEDH